MNTEVTEQETQQQEPLTIWNKTFISLFITNMAFNMGFLMSNSLIAAYANSLGASVSAIGMIASAFSISSILFRLVSGPIMDTYNRKFIIMFSTLMMAIAFFGFSMSRSVAALMVFRLVQGCGMAFGNSCCLTMVADAIPKEKYGSGIGYYSAAQVIAQAIGPAIGIWLVGLVDYKMTFIINVCIMLVATVLAFQIRTNFKRTNKLKLRLNNIIAKEALLPAGVMFLQHGGSIITSSLIVVYADLRGVTANIGLYFTAGAVTMLISRPIIGKLTDKFGLVRVLIPALACNVIAFFIISSSSSLISFLLAAFIASFGQGACAPAVQALSMKAVPNERRGAASSTNFIGMDLGNLTGPTIAGGIADSVGFSPMWRIMTVPFILAALLVFMFRKTVARIETTFTARQSS